MWTSYREACCSRGDVPEWDESYIERNLPSELVEKMHSFDNWVDDDGYRWGFTYVFATKLKNSGEPMVVVASKSMNQGDYFLKYWHGVIKKCTSDQII
jgi:hypothetical protein